MRVQELGTAFQLLDTNHDREISLEEVTACCSVLNRRLSGSQVSYSDRTAAGLFLYIWPVLTCDA